MEEKEYEIWVSGYRATGEDAKAYLYGKSKGKDFFDACERLLGDNPSFEIDDPIANHPYAPGLKRMGFEKSAHLWICKLYDNETDARKHNG